VPPGTLVGAPGPSVTLCAMGADTVIEMAPEVPRRGPRPRTSARAIALVGLQLFAEQGFQETTIDQIAAAAQVSRTTFFRYFDSKSDLVWNEFDAEAESLRSRLAVAPAGVPTMQAVRQAVIEVNNYQPDYILELRSRTNLISSAPELAASAAAHYDGWMRAISDFVALRTGQSPDALFPTAVGRATLAVCRAAFEHWARTADADLITYLDLALRALASGFADSETGIASR
jgi:mycofactocin system transcriptional regulator